MDIIETINHSLIQHGKFNDRIYLMKLSQNGFPDIIDKLEKIARDNQYTKIFAKIPSWAKDKFEQNEYIEEGFIPNFYNGEENACFMGKYLSKDRKINTKKDEIENIINTAKAKETNNKNLNLDPEFKIRKLFPIDAKDMADIYKKVFETYPFPIHNENYLIKTMDENLIYFGIFKDNKLIALSSCEMDEKNLNVEMTDFACLEEFRGNKLAYFLLAIMEDEMKKKGFKSFYTIARALSFGMNITFAKLGYKFAGTLINNTNISGGLESMNIWYKNV